MLFCHTPDSHMRGAGTLRFKNSIPHRFGASVFKRQTPTRERGRGTSLPAGRAPRWSYCLPIKPRSPGPISWSCPPQNHKERCHNQRNYEAPIPNAFCRDRTSSGSAMLHMPLPAFFDSGFALDSGCGALGSELPSEVAVDPGTEFRNSDQAYGFILDGFDRSAQQ